MAVIPAVRTWSDNDPLDTTNLNTGIRDPLAFLLSPPRAELRQTTPQTFTTAVAAAVRFNAEDVDTDYLGVGGHDNVTNNTRWAATYAGWYVVSGAVTFLANGTGDRFCWLQVNGVDVPGSMGFMPADATGVTPTPARTRRVALAVGDYVELIGFQSSGADLATSGTGREQSSLSIHWVSVL